MEHAGAARVQTQGLILQASLAKIGIKLVIQNNELATWVAKFYPGGKSSRA